MKFKKLTEQIDQHKKDNSLESVVSEMSGYQITEVSIDEAEVKSGIIEGHDTIPFAPKEILDEAVAPEQYGLANYRGGVIVFSTDVNAVSDDAKSMMAKLKQFVRNKFDSFKNRVLKNQKLVKLIDQHNLSGEDDMFIGAFSIGNFFSGRYVGFNGRIYDERSASIEIGGVPSEVLLLLGTAIAKEFKQESVLVKDFNRNKFYLADSRKVEDVSKEVKKI